MAQVKPTSLFMIVLGIVAVFAYFVFRKPAGSATAANYEPTNDNTGSGTNFPTRSPESEARVTLGY